MDNEKQKTTLNKTWILVAGLVILTAILLIISLTAKNNIIENPEKSEEVETESAQTSLIFSDQVRPGTPSGTYEVDININTNENKVTLAQLEMSYDPRSLLRVDIRPGNFINDPVIIQKSIDASEGRIKYWIGIKPNQNGIRGSGVIATLSFSKPGTAGAQINFLPKTSVSAAGTDQSVLKNMISGYIFNIPTPTLRTTITGIPTQQQ